MDPQTSKVTAIALGSTEVQTTDLQMKCDEEDARKLAAASLHCEDVTQVKTLAKHDIFFVFGYEANGKQAVRLVDHRGFIKVQVGDAVARVCKTSEWEDTVAALWKQQLSYKSDMVMTPDFFLCIGGKVLDFSNTLSLEQLQIIMRSEFMDAVDEEDVILIAAKTEIR